MSNAESRRVMCIGPMYSGEIKEARGRVFLVKTLPFSKCRLYSVDEYNTSVYKWCKVNDVEKPKCFGGEPLPVPLFQRVR
jgi:hypothetical protein